MSIYNKQIVVNYTIEQMYALVSDVNSYPEFIPLITSAHKTKIQDEQISATFTISKGLLSFSFSTINRLEPNKRITMHLASGPFRKFKGAWEFTPQKQGQSSIAFYLEFEFSSTFFCILLDSLFKQLCEIMLHAFRMRAAKLYD